MKKMMFRAVAATAVALLSACETLAPSEGTLPHGVSGPDSDKVVLTATIGSDTKTYLEWDGNVFKTRWAEGDEILVLDSNKDYTKNDPDSHYGYFELSSGVGESTATFVLEEGVLPESFIAAYGEMWPSEITGDYIMWLSRFQYREQYETKSGEMIQGFSRRRYPMVAEGTGTSCSFRNLCAVLKLNLTGNGELLKKVYVSSLDEGVYLGGSAVLDLTSYRPSLRFSPEDISEEDDALFYDYIDFEPRYYDEAKNEYIDVCLSGDPVECYIVLPAQTYPSGLKITVETEDGLMEVQTENNLVLSQSELREIPTLNYNATVDFADKWRLVSDESSDIAFLDSMEGDYLVAKNYYVDEYAYLNLFYGEQKYSWSEEYSGYSSQITNTCGKLQRYDNEAYAHMEIRHEGYYDIYLNPNTLDMFIMSDGLSPDHLPTTEHVVCHDYERFLDSEQMPDNSPVKVYGSVTAVSAEGILVALNGYGSKILVYSTDFSNVEVGDAVELYAVKTTWAGLPELKDVTWYRVYKSRYSSSYGYSDITRNFDSWSSTYYSAIRFTGILSISGSYINVLVDGATRIGSIQTPRFEVSKYDGQKVMIEGWYAGVTTSTTGQEYLNVILSRIVLPDTDGSTEDVVPDDDIILSSR